MEPTAAPVRVKDKATPDQLDQEQGKKQEGKGRLGSLENPEVYDNVPGHLIPIIEHEFDDFDTAIVGNSDKYDESCEDIILER